jgi:hypothetical protein
MRRFTAVSRYEAAFIPKFVFYHHHHQNTVTGYVQKDRGSVAGSDRNFSLCHDVHTADGDSNRGLLVCDAVYDNSLDLEDGGNMVLRQTWWYNPEDNGLNTDTFLI